MVCFIIPLKGGDVVMKRYRIGEFAKRMSVTLDFIRFYEEKGLIESTVDPRNNYHYYDVSQSEIIYKIQQYRNLGFNVSETVELIRHANKDQMLAMFGARSEAHSNAIVRSRYAINYLDFLQRALSTQNGTWYISRLPAFWFMSHTLGDDYLDSLSIQSTFTMWAAEVPLNFSMTKWALNNDGALSALYHGRAMEQSVAKEFNFVPHNAVELVPEKRCIEYYFDYAHPKEFSHNMGPSLSLANIQPALDIVREKNFEIDGDIFDRHVAFYNEKGLPYSKLVIYIPIK